MVSKFNEFFINIGPALTKNSENSNNSVTDTMPLANTSFFISSCTASELKTTVMNLKNSNGNGIIIVWIFHTIIIAVAGYVAATNAYL